MEPNRITTNALSAAFLMVVTATLVAYDLAIENAAEAATGRLGWTALFSQIWLLPVYALATTGLVRGKVWGAITGMVLSGYFLMVWPIGGTLLNLREGQMLPAILHYVVAAITGYAIFFLWGAYRERR
jgi:hypothetical protein